MAETTGKTNSTGARAGSISACVIARDEEQRLPDCLRSVAFCDEIVVVDSGSRDRTVAIAREHGARVVAQPWLGFGAQRNVAIDHAHGEWILEVDADERVSEQLGAEIRAFLAAPPDDVDVAVLPLRERFLGAQLGPSAKYPRYRTRLFRRGVYRHDEERRVHEGLWPRARTWAFEGSLEHLLAGSWREALHDGWTYAGLEAGQSPAPRGPGAWLGRIVVRPLAKLGYRLFVDGGWRDGAPGLAKIALDCAIDASVGVRQLLRRPPGLSRPTGSEDDAGAGGRDGPAHAGSGAGGHYARSLQIGSVRILALALGDDAAAEAEVWLERARAAGADVGIVTDARADANDPLRVRRLAGGGPLSLIRALDAEDQLRPVDALVPFGPAARRLVRRVPRRALHVGAVAESGATGSAPPDPATAVEDLRASSRGPVGAQ